MQLIKLACYQKEMRLGFGNAADRLKQINRCGCKSLSFLFQPTCQRDIYSNMLSTNLQDRRKLKKPIGYTNFEDAIFFFEMDKRKSILSSHRMRTASASKGNRLQKYASVKNRKMHADRILSIVSKLAKKRVHSSDYVQKTRISKKQLHASNKKQVFLYKARRGQKLQKQRNMQLLKQVSKRLSCRVGLRQF